jgi:hypothetical protein
MTLRDYLGYLATWSLIGAALFSAFVVFAFRSGVVYASRKQDGTLKDRIPLRGYVAMAVFLLTIVALFMLANYLGLSTSGASLGFAALFALNFVLYLILFVFDTMVVDGFVLGYWRPGFLRLSKQIGRESMREHIAKSIPIGLAFGVLIAGLAAAVSSVAFTR